MTAQQRIVLSPTQTAAWRALVLNGSMHSGHRLTEDLESYLVTTLMRMMTRTDLTTVVFATALLEAMNCSSEHRREGALRDIGDQSLLYAGWFPQHARRHNVHAGYFVEIGRCAYTELAHTSAKYGALYDEIAGQFVTLMDILNAMRAPEHTPFLDTHTAKELWEHTGSTVARRLLRAYRTHDTLHLH